MARRAPPAGFAPRAFTSVPRQSPQFLRQIRRDAGSGSSARVGSTSQMRVVGRSAVNGGQPGSPEVANEIHERGDRLGGRPLRRVGPHRGQGHVLYGQQGLRGYGGQLIEALAERFRGQGGDAPSLLLGQEPPGRALDDGAAEQAARGGSGQQGCDGGASAGLAEERHVVRVAAEGRDVLVHPHECGGLVEEAAVGGRPRNVPEPLESDAVVERHHDHPAPGEYLAVVAGIGAVARLPPATVDPHHDRQPVAGSRAGDLAGRGFDDDAGDAHGWHPSTWRV